MKVTPLVAAIGIVLVLVLAGGITSGLILARDQASPSVREAPISPAPDSKVTEETGPRVTPTFDIEGPPGIKPTAISDGEEGIVTGEDSRGPEGAKTGAVYTWQDGDETRRVVLQPRQEPRKNSLDANAAQDTAGTGAVDTTEDGVSKKEDLGNSVRRDPETMEDQPVFLSESGGELMTLPGGIILALYPEWDEAAVEKFFSGNGISRDRATEIEYLDNGFLVKTAPGLPSLELANALAGQEGVILSSPNWAREMELK